jgi:hypothetical protein
MNVTEAVIGRRIRFVPDATCAAYAAFISSAPHPNCQIDEVRSVVGGVATLLNRIHDFCVHTASITPAKRPCSASNFVV